MIRRGWPDHFNAADLAVFDQEGLGDQNAGRPIEAFECVLAAIGEHAFVHRALIEHGVRPDHASLHVHYRVAPMVNALDHEIVPQLELRQAIEREAVDRVFRLVGRPRNVGGVRAVFDAVAIVGEVIGAGAVDALPVVFLQAAEVAVGDGNHLRARRSL